MRISKLDFTTTDEISTSLEFLSNTEKNNNNTFSLILGNNGSGKTACIEAILSLFSSRFQSGYVRNATMRMDTDYNYYFDSSNNDMRISDEKNYIANGPVKKVVVSTYSPYDRILTRKNSPKGTRNDSDFIDISYPEHDSLSIQSLGSTSYLKSKLLGDEIAIQQVAKIIDFETNDIALQIETTPSLDGKTIYNSIINLTPYDKKELNKSVKNRMTSLGVNSTKIIENIKRDSRKNIKEIVDNFFENDKDRELLIIFAIIVEIKDLLIKCKRSYYLSGDGLPSKQLISTDHLVDGYKKYYSTNYSKHVILEIILEDIKILESTKFFMVNNLFVKKGSRYVALTDFSSGEFSFFSRIMELNSSLVENSIVLIDEPETHLNPKWIFEYIHLLKKVFRNRNAHFIIMSQSPFVVGSIKKEDILHISLPEQGMNGQSQRVVKTFEEETLGALLDKIMKEVFGIDYSDNKVLTDYIKQIEDVAKNNIIEALRMSGDLAETPKKIELMENLLSEENIELVEEQIDKLEGEIDG